MIHVQQFRNNIDMTESFDSSGPRWEHPQRTLPLTWCQVNPSLLSDCLSVRLFQPRRWQLERIAHQPARWLLSRAPVEILHNSFDLSEKIQWTWLNSVPTIVKASEAWVEGLMRALPDPLIATGKHRYQGGRRGTDHEGSGNLGTRLSSEPTIVTASEGRLKFLSASPAVVTAKEYASSRVHVTTS